jgi:DNA repair exonuclease SbcCD ATPase subunit
LSAQTQLPLLFVESELKSYAREKPGLATRRMDGRLVMFSQSASVAPVATAARLPSPLRGVIDMPFIERLRALFSRKGDVEKKIALLSERRAALTQQRDRGYDEMGTLESKESSLRKEFADSNSDLSRRRVTSQLVQLRKDIARRQELLTVLNQQINVISTHLHTLELQRQGKAANLPDGDELAADAAKAEQVLAELEANSEFADGVGTSSAGSLSSEEQALYDELIAQKPESAQEAAEKPVVKSEPIKPPPLPTSSAQQKQRPQAEPG